MGFFESGSIGADPSTMSDGWANVAALVAQWPHCLDPDPTIAFLEAHDPFPAAFDVTYTGSTRQPATVVQRLGTATWLVLLENGTEVEADLAALVPRAPVMRAEPSLDVVTAAPRLVCVDSMEENLVPQMALRAHVVLPKHWNGWARPLATADAVADFLRRWRANDLNGVWGFAVELGDALLVTRSDGEEPDYFAPAGCCSDGTTLYDLTGWVWVVIPS